MLVHPSIADIPEGDLVERLLAEPVWRSRLIGLHSIPESPLIRQKVPLAGVPGDFPGDVDILLCSPCHPDLAVAIEVKRIKFGISAIRSGRPNKLHEFEKAVQQANRLASIGFSQVYLYVFAVIDTREQNSGQNTYVGLSPKLKGLIYRSISPSGLDERVGLCQVEIVQPMDYPPLGTGAWGGHLRRGARTVTQTEELTKWVSQLPLAKLGLCASNVWSVTSCF
jgi:hypothetical protein